MKWEEIRSLLFDLRGDSMCWRRIRIRGRGKEMSAKTETDSFHSDNTS